MITVTCYRNNGEECTPHTRQQTLDAALNHLVEFEYGYGGLPVRVEPTVVEVHTRVLNCSDRTVWTGTEAEMAPLVEVSSYVAATCTKEINNALAEAVAPKLLELKNGFPFLVSGLAGMFSGKARLRTACLLWCDGPALTDAAVALAQRLPLSDLVSTVVLARECKQSFVQTCAQLGVE